MQRVFAFCSYFFAQSLHFLQYPLAQSKAAGYILGMDWSLHSSAYLEAEGKGYEECRNVWPEQNL